MRERKDERKKRCGRKMPLKLTTCEKERRRKKESLTFLSTFCCY